MILVYMFGGLGSIVAGMTAYAVLALNFSPAGVWNGADLLGLIALLVGVFYGAHLFAKSGERSDQEMIKRLKEMENEE